MSVSPPAQYVIGGALDAPFYPTLPEPYFKGFKGTPGPGDTFYTWIAPFDIELLGVAMACETYDIEDNWSLIVDGRYIAETIYTKDLPEGLHFMTCKYIKKGQKVFFKYTNTGEPKSIWFNYQCLRDEDVIDIVE